MHDYRKPPIWRNTDSAAHAARIADVRYEEFMEVADMLGFRTLNGRLERHEIRKVLAKLIVRTNQRDQMRTASLRAAFMHFADEKVA